jgi:hypothetical protein
MQITTTPVDMSSSNSRNDKGGGGGAGGINSHQSGDGSGNCSPQINPSVLQQPQRHHQQQHEHLALLPQIKRELLLQNGLERWGREGKRDYGSLTGSLLNCFLGLNY